MSDRVDADCPECGSSDTYFSPFEVDGAFAGGEFQCYGCGHSATWDL